MQTQARFVMGWIFLAAVGCGTRSTLAPADAGGKKDGVAGPDSFVMSDAFEVASGTPDLAPNPDVAKRDDTSPAAFPDLAAPDTSPDNGVPDTGFDAGSREVLSSDVMVVGDGSAWDVAADRASPDVVSRDVAAPDLASPDVDSPDAAGDAIFSSIDGPLAVFCTGDYPHMVVNGIDSHPAVSGRMIPYDCCDGGDFKVVTATFIDLIVVSWQARAGATSRLPATIDLANPPSGWNVRIDIGCDTATASCYPSPDAYTTGLQGMLQVSRGTSGYEMSLCLHVQEPADSPHPIVHTLDLYAPHVKTN